MYVCEPARQLTCGALGGGTGVGRRTKPTEEQAPRSFYLHRQEQGGAVREEYKDCTAPSDAPPTFAHAHLVVRAVASHLSRILSGVLPESTVESFCCPTVLSERRVFGFCFWPSSCACDT
jgi:hypothetical protein